jgi:hypothetical protein
MGVVRLVSAQPSGSGWIPRLDWFGLEFRKPLFAVVDREADCFADVVRLCEPERGLQLRDLSDNPVPFLLGHVQILGNGAASVQGRRGSYVRRLLLDRFGLGHVPRDPLEFGEPLASEVQDLGAGVEVRVTDVALFESAVDHLVQNLDLPTDDLDLLRWVIHTCRCTYLPTPKRIDGQSTRSRR